MTRPALSQVEQAILEILDSDPGEEVRGRDLRSRLRSRGFRRTAPALVFTLLRLEDKGLVACREEVRDVGGVEIRERYYRKYPNAF
jgi:DNA-binding PadR family transcriptional regulator